MTSRKGPGQKKNVIKVLPLIKFRQTFGSDDYQASAIRAST